MQGVERVRPLPAVCAGLLRRGGAISRRKLQQVPLRAAELVGLLLETRGGSGWAVVAGIDADLRGVVGLQVHGRNIPHLTVVPVQQRTMNS